jgi:Fe-S-cluster-containing dehydrogenase component/formate-dependent nitrite reductase membrane component NrfD
MPNFGFAIDLRKCIGCHACTIACKAEHDIPIGVNRCWVKTVEKGTFPDARRFFFPVLCNQCDAAPCVRICPTRALFKRGDGIVDLDGEACIGCRACMQACPYDQLFIDPGTRTAEKCNFCANRIEQELLPACVIVCPTECRVFGDLDDPSSAVARIVAAQPVSVRKPEKGTLPKILYVQADDSVIRPEVAARPLMYREGQVHLRPLASPVPVADAPGDPRVDYDVPHGKPWGWHLVLYLFAKGIAAGALLLAAVLWVMGEDSALVTAIAPVLALAGNAITDAVLVLDLERPERFHYLLTRPNWRSWLVWGAWFLIGHAAVSAGWLLAWWLDLPGLRTMLAAPAVIVSVAVTCYSGFLFAQGLGRDLWQGPLAAVDLLFQAVAMGAAVLLACARLLPDVLVGSHVVLVGALVLSLLAHGLVLVFEHVLGPSPTRHHHLAVRAIVSGPFRRLFWGGALAAGVAFPLALVAHGAIVELLSTPAVLAASALVLAGNMAWDYVWVEAGQSVPLS